MVIVAGTGPKFNDPYVKKVNNLEINHPSL
jgi:hypothetical protein